jgi:hypothetical protein
VKRILLLPVLLFFSAVLIFSVDFGLLINQDFEATNEEISYTPAFTPWFSWNGGKGTLVYLSGIFSFNYYNYDNDAVGSSGWVKPALRPELSRFAVSHRISPRYSLEAGRINYADVMDFTASGLFDGVRFDALTSLGSISAGAFYTGFLYKETAEILMTAHDVSRYAEAWNGDFDTYGASRRTFAAVRWDMPLGEAHTLSVEALFQFDLNDTDDILHSQYGEVQAALYFPHVPEITVGALFETMENKNGDLTAAWGGLAGIKMDIPGSLNDRLSAAIKFGSGQGDNTLTAIAPISARTQGMVFTGAISGLAYLSADYLVRVLDALFLDGSVRYFMRTYDDPAAEGNLYGGEFWASAAWQPFDDIRLTLGGGVFFPGSGNIYPDGTDPMWKFIAGLSLSL